MNSSIESSLEMATLEKAHRLAAVAEVLKSNNMPQELINMILAARCNLPMAKVEPRDPRIVWTEENTKTPAPEAQPRSLDERREVVLREVEGLDMCDIAHVLSSALNIALADTGDQAIVTIRPLVVYHVVDGKI